MINMRVDLNRRDGRGFVRASRKRADGPIEAGAFVRIYQPGEDFVYVAEVVELDANGLALLDVQWPPEQLDGIAGGTLAVRSGAALRSAGTQPTLPAVPVVPSEPQVA